MSQCFRISIITLGILLAVPVFAASSDANVIMRTLIGTDTGAPTTPTGVVTTPIATSQIDIVWASSTDDTGVTGYQLYRDAVLITTTALLNFSDTGLTASTTYSYTVVAFDGFSNFSSSSLASATSTFALPPPTPTATSTDTQNPSTRVPASLTSFSLTPSTNGARVVFETSSAVQYLLRYGEASVYDGSSIKSNVFAKSHETMLTGLTPGTRYEYELFGYDRFGREVLLKRDSFTTSDEVDTDAPANVSFFTAQPITDDVFLNWTLPTENDFSYVRILRNHLFFPVDPNDGYLVYEGRASSFRDMEALSKHGTQYYTIFSYDSSGNRSSGAIAIARKAGVVPSEEPDGLPVASTTPGVPGIDFTQVEIVQNGKVMPLKDGALQIAQNNPFTVRIPYELFPQQLKVITVTLTHPTLKQQVFSFLLRANQDFTYYEATLAALPEAGEYEVTFSVFNVFANEIMNFAGLVEVSKATPLSEPVVPTEEREVLLRILLWLLLIILALITLRFILFGRRRREDNEAVEK